MHSLSISPFTLIKAGRQQNFLSNFSFFSIKANALLHQVMHLRWHGLGCFSVLNQTKDN